MTYESSCHHLSKTDQKLINIKILNTNRRPIEDQPAEDQQKTNRRPTEDQQKNNRRPTEDQQRINRGPREDQQKTDGNQQTTDRRPRVEQQNNNKRPTEEEKINCRRPTEERQNTKADNISMLTLSHKVHFKMHFLKKGPSNIF